MKKYVRILVKTLQAYDTTTNDYHSEGEMVHDPVTGKIIWIGGYHRFR